MAGILIQFNQALTRAMSWTNLKVRHLGWSDADGGFWFKRDDGSAAGDPHHVPSTIGQGMGRRVTQNAHGFVEKWLVRYDGAAWVSASAAALETFATHMVVRVISANVFEVAQVGAWAFSGIVPGPIYLSASVPGTTASTPEGLGQKVATGIGDSYHLLLGGSPTAASSGGPVESVSFNLTPGPVDPDAAGTMYWNPTEHTIDIVLEGGSILSVGFEDLLWVKNREIGTITDGQLVYISGASGDNPEVRLATNNDPAKWDCIAMVTQPIGASNNGIVARGGKVRSLNTAGHAAGTKMYLGTGGAFTATKPTKPTMAISIGYVLREHANQGVILFKPDQPHALSLLSDADTTGAADGDLLRRNADGVWTPAHVTISESAPVGAPGTLDAIWYVVEPEA